MEDVRALANDALSEEQMRHWPACRAEGYTCGVHAEPWPCHFARLVDAVTLLTDALDEAAPTISAAWVESEVRRAEKAEAALDRVRAILEEMDSFYMEEERRTTLVQVSAVLDNVERLRAAIEGES